MSSTLQIGLAITGGLVLAGLVAHNTWQARKNQPKRADPPAPQPRPGHAQGSAPGRTEPVLHGAGADAAAAPANLAPAGAATAGAAFAPLASDAHAAPADSGFFAPQPFVPTMFPAQAVEKKAVLDPLLDALAPIVLDQGALVSGEAALAALPATRRVDNKPFAVEGHDCASGEWEPIVAGHWYDQFQAGVQLANRSGALNEIGFSEFTLKTQAFADAVNGTPQFPDMVEEVARARELDQFASAHDARLSFLLRACHAAWSIGYLQQVAARHGFVAGALPGRMVLPSANEGAAPLLSLEFDTQAALAEDLEHSAIYEILLGLEITHVPRTEQPYGRMCHIARQLAQEMDGSITDGNGHRIEPSAMEHIATDLQGLHHTLEQRDFAAGSALARRLFS